MPDCCKAFKADPPILNGAHNMQNHAARVSSLHNEIHIVGSTGKPQQHYADWWFQRHDVQSGPLMSSRRLRFDIIDYKIT